MNQLAVVGLALLPWLLPCQTTPCLSQCSVDKIKREIWDHMDTLKVDIVGDDPDVQKDLADFTGGVVRLSFHDAGTYSIAEANGGPDGCLDVNDPDNAGLDVVIDNMVEPLYQPWKDRLSKADFWALAANAAIEKQAVDKKGKSRGYELNFRYGRIDRTDCLAMDAGRLPAADRGWQHVKDVFVTRMGLSIKDITALIGAHTLGRTEGDLSGFIGPWTVPVSQHIWDTQFYLAMITTDWVKLTNENGKPQWNFLGMTPSDNQLMLLNTDIALFRENAENENCTRISEAAFASDDACGALNPETWALVNDFTKHEEWFPAYKTAFQKMQEFGYPSADLYEVGVCPADADPDPTACPPPQENGLGPAAVAVLVICFIILFVGFVALFLLVLHRKGVVSICFGAGECMGKEGATEELEARDNPGLMEEDEAEYAEGDEEQGLAKGGEEQGLAKEAASEPVSADQAGEDSSEDDTPTAQATTDQAGEDSSEDDTPTVQATTADVDEAPPAPESVSSGSDADDSS